MMVCGGTNSNTVFMTRPKRPPKKEEMAIKKVVLSIIVLQYNCIVSFFTDNAQELLQEFSKCHLLSLTCNSLWVTKIEVSLPDEALNMYVFFSTILSKMKCNQQFRTYCTEAVTYTQLYTHTVNG